MDGKSIIKSKTFWVNVIAMLAIALQGHFGDYLMLDSEQQVALLGFVNILLRIITKQPINWSK